MYERVVKLAEAKGLSFYKLEREAGIPNGTIGKWKNGRSADIKTIVKLAKALDVSVDYLVGITDEQ